MKLAILFSGGKDSTYALYKVMEQNEISCLISIISKNPNSYMFHTPNINLTELQAKSINIPLLQKTTKGEKEKELEDLKQIISQAKEKYNIQGIVTGALASSYQKKRIEKICKELNLRCINPLWHYNQEKLMREMINNNFKFIITSIAADGLDESWLGKTITNKDIDYLVELNKKNGINIAFEGGEAETLMVSGPIFKKELKILKAEKIMENNYTGIYNINKAKLIS